LEKEDFGSYLERQRLLILNNSIESAFRVGCEDILDYLGENTLIIYFGEEVFEVGSVLVEGY
jgi:hypothetical protein